MCLDDKVIYVFARQDLPVAKQLVHTNHAVFQMAMNYGKGWLGSNEGIPSVIVIGVPNEKALHRVSHKLAFGDRVITACRWFDPMYPDLGLAAIATVPLSQEEKTALACYRIYKPV